MIRKTALLALAPPGLALLAGAGLPFQAASNAHMGRTLGHPLWGALVSLLVSLMVVVPALWALRAPTPAVAKALQGPWWLWIGGVITCAANPAVQGRVKSADGKAVLELGFPMESLA